MTAIPPTRRIIKPSEQGYVLLGVLILLAVFIIGMAVAAPKIAYDIQRDRELETMQRGKQYIRAIQLYYKKFNAYPPNIDALVKTNEIRFLRKRYIDPITGKDDWKPIMFGQNKAPLAMGFFGQPLGGPGMGSTPIAGTGPGGANGMQGGSAFGGQNSTSPTGSSIFNNGPTSSTSPTGSSIFSDNPTTPTTPTSPAPGTPGTQNSPTDQSSAGQTAGAAGTTATAGTTDANGNPTTGDNGATFGGGGIIGVSPKSEKKSILVYKKKDHYNQWEFTYSQLMDMQNGGGGNAGTIGQPVGGTGTGIGGTSPVGPGTGTGIGGPGTNGPGGASPIQSPTTPTPQQ